jgi:hypothetical protein
MTGHEKMAAAFSEGGVSEFPAVICYEGLFTRDHWPQLTQKPWWVEQSPDLEEQLGLKRDIFDKLPTDWFHIRPYYNRAERLNLAIVTEGADVYRVNRQTNQKTLIPRPRVGGWLADAPHSVRRDKPACSREEIDALIPDPAQLSEISRIPASAGRREWAAGAKSFDPAAFRSSGVGDLAHACIREFGQDRMPFGHVASSLWCCYGIWGFEDMMTMALDHPELVEHACRRLTENTLFGIRARAAMGAKVIWIEECLTDMVSPDTFARLNVPFLKQITREIHEAGMKSVYYYCGNPEGKWDHILSVGADALAFEESKKGFTIDIKDVVWRVKGRCTVFGNLDSVGMLQNGTEAQLRDEIKRQMQAGRQNDNRFVMSIGSPVTPETPVSRVKLYLDLAHQDG